MTKLFIPAEEIQMEPVEWLWPDRIPRGALSIFEGDPGGGKSTVLTDIAARVSNGRELPNEDQPTKKGGILWLSAEDALPTTRRNLTVAGASLSAITIWNKSAGQLVLPDACEQLQREIETANAAMVVLDPISAFLPGSQNVESVVRKALGPLTAVAEQTNAAICIVRHLGKARGASALYRGAGSIGMIAVARSGLLIGREPGDSGRRVIAHHKSNIGTLSPTIAFSTVEEGGGVRVEWLGPCDLSAEDVLAGSPNEISAIQEACMVLCSILADGSVWASDAMKTATKAGISVSTLGRAKRLLQVKSCRIGFGKLSRFYWILPDKVAAQFKEKDLDALAESLFGGEPGPPDESSDDLRRRRRPPGFDDNDDDADWWKTAP